MSQMQHAVLASLSSIIHSCHTDPTYCKQSASLCSFRCVCNKAISQKPYDSERIWRDDKRAAASKAKQVYDLICILL